MRYLLITYVRKPNGQIDEQVGFGRRVKPKDLQTCNVIVDYAERKVLKCLIDGRVVDTDFEKLNEYYLNVYPKHIEEMLRMNGHEVIIEEATTETVEATEQPTEQPTTEKKDGQ